MAPFGTVSTTFTLDKTEYQGLEPVTGVVSVYFRPTTSTSSTTRPDLFGPLKLCVTLQGNLQINVAENRTSHACIFFTEKRKLLFKSEELHNGPFRAAAKESQQFPFQIQFPHLTDTFRGHKDLLPPTFYTEFSAVAVRMVGKHHGSASIIYDVRVEAEMPGIDVTISNETPPRKIRYLPSGQLSNNARTEFSRTLQVQSYDLLPEQDRPSLFEKTKAKMNSVAKPSFAFTVTCVGYPDSIAVGEEVKFDLRIRTESQGTTTNSVPEISLGDCKAEILARTQLYATNQRGADSARIDGSDVEATLALTKQKPDGLFKKENDFTKTLIFEPVPKDTPCTFIIKKLGRSYRLRLELHFLVSGQKIMFEPFVNLRILPPRPASITAPEAGPSRRNGVDSVLSDGDFLPNYYEIGHSAPPFNHVQ